jgi:hypothetical protein
MAQKVVMPLGIFYSPFLANVEQLTKGRYPTCSKCKAAICQQSAKIEIWASGCALSVMQTTPSSKDLAMKLLNRAIRVKQAIVACSL